MKKEPSNYRPISLISVVCKVLERMICDHITEHLNINNLLSNKEYGFISGRSVSQKLLTVMNDWTKIMDKEEAVDVTYPDFMKAVDKLPQRRLTHKIRSLGVNPINLVEPMHREFSYRKHTKVVYNRHSSAAKKGQKWQSSRNSYRPCIVSNLHR